MRKIILIVTIVLAFFLRIYQIDQVPPSLYWDETSLGYNAYSISQTLRDEHGNFLPYTSFPAFGDYKPVGYIYAIVPFIKVFGLNEITVRLPSILAGTLLVFSTYLLIAKIKDQKTALLAALFVAVSPWSIQMSRAAFEANLATLFSVLGIYFFISRHLVFSAIFFVFSMYTFNSHRVFVPIMIGGLSLIFFEEIFYNLKKFVVFYLLFIFLLLPLIPHMLSTEGKLRFNEVSWVNDLSIVQTSNDLIAKNNNSVLSKIIYNRRVFYAQAFISHYIDHYRFDFLFQKGDINPRLSDRQIGELYLYDLPLIIIGVFFLLRKLDKTTLLLFFWLLVAPVPASVARETPHALRILNVLPVPMIFAAIGLNSIKKYRVFGIMLALFVCIYLMGYYSNYAKTYAADWQYGYKQMVEYVSTIENNYDHIFVSGHYGRPYIYLLFYKQFDSQKYWINRDASRDSFGFWTVRSFDKYYFEEPKIKTGKWLYAYTKNENIQGKKLIKDLGEFRLYE